MFFQQYMKSTAHSSGHSWMYSYKEAAEKLTIM